MIRRLSIVLSGILFGFSIAFGIAVLAAHGRAPVFDPVVWLVVLAVPIIGLQLAGSGALSLRVPLADKLQALAAFPVRFRQAARPPIQIFTATTCLFGIVLIVLGFASGLSRGAYQAGGRYYASPDGVVTEINRQEFYRMTLGTLRFEAGILILLYAFLFAFSLVEPYSARAAESRPDSA